MAIEAPSLAEVVSAILILGALGLSLWALIDDIGDLINVRRYGEVGGPRWVAAMEHFWFNATMLFGWGCFLGLISIAIYLPSRLGATESELGTVAGWLRLGYTAAFLVAQLHRRVGRLKMRKIPIESWERMLLSMFDGLTPQERISLSTRLLAATSAGRELGHLIANRLGVPVGLIDIVLTSAVLTERQRADLSEARDHILAVSDNAAGLHAEIKRQEAAL